MTRMIGNDTVISILLEEAGHLSGFTPKQIRAHFEKGFEQLRERGITLTESRRRPPRSLPLALVHTPAACDMAAACSFF